MFYINEIISRNQREKERERDASLKIMSNISPSDGLILFRLALCLSSTFIGFFSKQLCNCLHVVMVVYLTIFFIHFCLVIFAIYI